MVRAIHDEKLVKKKCIELDEMVAQTALKAGGVLGEGRSISITNREVLGSNDGTVGCLPIEARLGNA